MSNAALDWAMAAPIRGVAKPVLIVLANRADANGQCFPLIATICHESGFGDRAVRESLKQLEREGWLTIIRQKGNTLKYQLATERRESSASRAGPAPDAEHDRPAPDAGQSGATCRTVRQEMPDSPAPNAGHITQSNPNITQNNPNRARERARPLPDADFAEFWKVYPRKVSKRHAAKAWLAAIKRAPPAEILTGLANATFSDDGKFIPHPATWLNGDRWMDEACPTKKKWRNGFLQLAVEAAQGKPPPAREPNAVEIALGLAPALGALRRVH